MDIQKKIANGHLIVRMGIWLGWMAVLSTIMMVCFTTYTARIGYMGINALRTLQAVQTFCVFIFPAMLSAWMWSKRPFTWLRMNVAPNAKLAGLTFAMMLIALPGINLMADLNTRIELPAALADWEAQLKAAEEQAQALIEAFMQVDTFMGMLGCVVLLALLPAIGEEMCFRGTFQGLLTRETGTRLSRRTHLIVWGIAIIFSAAHFQFYGFFPRMILGAVLGYLAVWSGNLWIPIVAHFTNNAASVVFYLLGAHTSLEAEAMENFGTGNQWWLGATSLVLAGIMLYYVRSVAQTQSSTLPQECPAEE